MFLLLGIVSFKKQGYLANLPLKGNINAALSKGAGYGANWLNCT